MRKITEVTRGLIVEYVKKGFNVPNMTWYESADFGWQKIQDGEKHISMKFNGRISELDFLKRIYPLDTMPSDDKRFLSALEDIKQHTVTFKDWPDFWFFDDDRFELTEGSEDEPLLRFLCEMFHPAVRDEEGEWLVFLNKLNELLAKDGYELYSDEKISDRDVYKYRECSPVLYGIKEEEVFSQRYRDFISTENGIQKDCICDCVSDQIKDKIISILDEFSEVRRERPYKDNYEISTDDMFMALEKLNSIHDTQIIELNELGFFGNRYIDCLKRLFTPYLFDLVELEYKELSQEKKGPFSNMINAIFQRNQLPFYLSNNGFIEHNGNHEVLDSEAAKNILSIKEPGLRELLNRAIALHKRLDLESKRSAMEAMWDALERLKTHYVNLGKKNSSQKIINDIAGEEKAFVDLFNNEFKALTDIGNAFQIRHHETDKIPITDIRHIDYFFNRCLSLVALAIQYLSNN
jgi:hypothetical protein